jgi:hypothetical protein
MKKTIALFSTLLFLLIAQAQQEKKWIGVKEVTRIETVLASDEMQGRRVFTPGIEKAADFIASEFAKIGLEKWKGANSYLQPFVISKQRNVAPHAASDSIPENASNVIGVLPGRSKPNEYVIFSAHYDHLGINSRRMVNNDSIYNGANDDAAGTTAMIMLAKYYKKMGKNERTLIFVAFTAEESGGFGARYFSRQFDPAQVMAMFNIEMIGTESKWGKNSAFITGYERTNMGELLQKNLTGTSFTFYPDPYPDQQLFFRSDNATLARLGVPAHTISTAKMDQEPHYHKSSDEVGTLDLENMTEIIRAIALSARGIVAGKETPSRVDTTALRPQRRATVAQAHSHNDYEQVRPFALAYERGFGSMEADIWLKEGELYVAHDAKDIRSERTLSSLYLDPLLGKVRSNNGKVYAREGQSLQLLIDIKSSARETVNKLQEVLERYPELINNKGIELVISGNRPPSIEWSALPAYLYVDGRPNEQYDESAMKKVKLISQSFFMYSRWSGKGEIPASDRSAMKAVVDAAHAKGKRFRFWASPDTPECWKLLQELGADHINTDKVSELAEALQGSRT